MAILEIPEVDGEGVDRKITVEVLLHGWNRCRCLVARRKTVGKQFCQIMTSLPVQSGTVLCCLWPISNFRTANTCGVNQTTSKGTPLYHPAVMDCKPHLPIPLNPDKSTAPEK